MQQGEPVPEVLECIFEMDLFQSGDLAMKLMRSRRCFAAWAPRGKLKGSR
jgi:hypothetical protein